MNITMEDIMDIMDRETVYETPSCFYAIHKPNRLLVRKAIPGEVLHTLNGNVTANEGDYVITGVNGEQYPCDPEIFKKLYDIEQ